MIFRPELVRKIRAGDKTMTRRPVKPGEKACRYEIGKAYAVQPGRGHQQVCRITITAIRQEPVGQITFADARKEGFRTRDDFNTYWATLYGTFNPDTPVWVITFELGDSTDTPRLLTSGAGRGRFKAAPGRKKGSTRQVVADADESQDYVTQPHLAMTAEPEAITEHEQQHQTAKAHERDAKRLADPDIKLRLSLTRALEEWELETGGRASNPDAFKSICAIRDQIRALDRRVKAA